MDIYAELKRRFEAEADDNKAKKMSAYMKNRFAFYGLPTPERRALYKDIIKEIKSGGRACYDVLDRCYSDSHREFKYFVIDALAAVGGRLAYDDVPRIKKYIQTESWWDTVDGFDTIVGDIGLTDERINTLMLDWSLDEDIWLRRTAIDCQLSRKDKTDTSLLEKIILNNLGSREFFINKAIGWSLREYSKTNPVWVREFIGKYREDMDKLSIREAEKYI